MVWDYAPNSQWLEARSMRIAYTNRSTIHAAVIEANETPQQIRDWMDQTLCKQTDDYTLLELCSQEVAGLDATALSRWLENRADWKEWRARHR